MTGVVKDDLRDKGPEVVTPRTKYDGLGTRLIINIYIIKKGIETLRAPWNQ